MITKYRINHPIEIVKSKLNAPKENSNLWVEEAYKLKNRTNRENNPSFQLVFNEKEDGSVVATDYKVWEETNVFNNLLKNILFNFQQNCLDNSSVNEKNSFIIRDAWLGVYEKSQLSHPHGHTPNHTSFCYYIFTEQPSSPMSFPSINLDIDVDTDTIIYFPSNVLHSVRPVPGKRIVLAGNIIPLLYKEETFFKP